jgi:hypothetical protein
LEETIYGRAYCNHVSLPILLYYEYELIAAAGLL